MSGFSDLFKQKHIPCRFCNEKVKPKKIFALRMNTAEGPHVMHVCPSCISTLQSVKGNIMQSVQHQRGFDDDDWNN